MMAPLLNIETLGWVGLALLVFVFGVIVAISAWIGWYK